jgi:hypothetical protein
VDFATFVADASDEEPGDHAEDDYAPDEVDDEDASASAAPSSGLDRDPGPTATGSRN